MSTPKPAKKPAFSAAERDAMKARAAELRADAKEQKAAAKRADALQGVLDAIAAMEDGDRALAEHFHAVVTEVAPQLEPKTWYGMPAYGRDGKAVCFFKPAAKFGARYATFGFNDGARLDDGALWPTEYAILEFTDEVDAAVRGIIARAAG